MINSRYFLPTSIDFFLIGIVNIMYLKLELSMKIIMNIENQDFIF